MINCTNQRSCVAQDSLWNQDISRGATIIISCSFSMELWEMPPLGEAEKDLAGSHHTYREYLKPRRGSHCQGVWALGVLAGAPCLHGTQALELSLTWQASGPAGRGLSIDIRMQAKKTISSDHASRVLCKEHTSDQERSSISQLFSPIPYLLLKSLLSYIANVPS